MLLTTFGSTDIVSSGVQAEGNFGFAINGKAFKVLSDTLYQDKIGSIVRETSCNAADSHNEAGCIDRPFEIHLPDSLEPWFSVKDYGVGMSHDTVMNVYTKFFESTKDQSNTQIGAFGLGSKTPFCYTDSFTIIAIHGGVKRSYSAMLNAAGTPTIALLDETETTEGNGVEINIAVQTNDYAAFSKATSEQLSFFKVKPTVMNSCGFTFVNRDTTNVILKDTNYVILKKNDTGYHHRSQIFLVQGGVGYPLNFELIRAAIRADTTDTNKLQMFCDILLNSGAYLYFNIGDIEVGPSREAVSYSERTIKNIVARIQEVKENYQKKILADLDSLPNDWDRALFLNQLGNLGDDFIDYKNRPFSKYQGTVGFSVDSFASQIETDSTGAKYTTKLFTVYNYSNSYSVGMARNVINAKSETQVYYKDACTYAGKRIRLYHQKHKNPDLYVIEPTSNNLNPLSIAELSKMLGDVKISKVSELPAPPRESTPGRPADAVRAKNTVVMEMDSEKFREYIGNWRANHTPLKDLLEKTAYYIEVEDYKNTFNVFSNEHIEYIQNLLDDKKLKYPIYLVNESKLTRVKNSNNWINLKEYITGEYDNHIVKIRNTIRKVAFINAIRDWQIPVALTNSLGPVLEDIPEFIADPKIQFLNKLRDRKNRALTNSKENNKNIATIRAKYYELYNSYHSRFVKNLANVTSAFNNRFFLLSAIYSENAAKNNSSMKAHITLYAKAVLSA